MFKEPQSSANRYAFGYSDKKPGWTWWLVHGLLVAFVLYHFVTIGHAEQADGYWTRMASKYNCAWVNEKRKIYSDEELARKAARWHVPQRLIELGKSCPR